MAIQVMGRQPEKVKQEKPERDIWDKLMLGLQAANGILGIKSSLENIETNNQNQQLNEIKLKEAQDQQAGIITPMQKAEMVSKGFNFTSGDEGPQPASVTAFKTPGGGQTFARFEPPTKQTATKTRAVTTVDEKGNKVTKVVEDKPGLVFEAPPEPTAVITPAEKAQARQAAGDKLAKTVTEYRSGIDAADESISLIDKAQDNPVAKNAAIFKLARAVQGGGVLTDRDVDRFGGSQAFADKLDQALTEIETGTLTVDNAKFMREVVTASRDRLATNMVRDIEDQVGRFGANYGGSYEENLKGLTGMDSLDKYKEMVNAVAEDTGKDPQNQLSVTETTVSNTIPATPENVRRAQEELKRRGLGNTAGGGRAPTGAN